MKNELASAYSLSEVVTGLRENQFRLALEPQIDLASGEVVGMECLVRWQHPDKGLLPPAIFVPRLEMAGMVTPLTLQVISRALDVRRRLREVGYHGSLSVNISARSLLDWTFSIEVARIAARQAESLRGITLELTESVEMGEEPLTDESLVGLSGLGVELALDDFWTGYSSLNKLHLDCFREVKIDYKLTSRIATDRVALAGVASIIAFACNLDWRCVAEGIESPQTIARLIDIGCRVGQGYYFSKPIHEDDIDRWFVEHTEGGRLKSFAAALAPQPVRLARFDDHEKQKRDRSPLLYWALNVDRMRVEWANRVGLVFWLAASLRDLAARDFSADMSAAVRERLDVIRRRVLAGEHVSEHWTVYPMDIPRPVFCTFTPWQNESGDLLLVIEAVEGFRAIAGDVDKAQLAEESPSATVLIDERGRLEWLNRAAQDLLALGVDTLGDVVADRESAVQFVRTAMELGECTTDLLIEARRCAMWHRVRGRRQRDPQTGRWKVLAALTPICDIKGCGWHGGTSRTPAPAGPGCEPH